MLPEKVDIPGQLETSNSLTRIAYQKLFNPEECQRIIDSVETFELSKVIDQNGKGLESFGMRSSEQAYLVPNPENQWIFNKLQIMIMSANKQLYHFEIHDLTGCQVIKYQAGDFYDWHIDLGFGEASRRKLSLIVFLTRPGMDFEGGEVQWSAPLDAIPQEQGVIAVFPSYLPHRVKKITGGTRYSLVGWANGLHYFK